MDLYNPNSSSRCRHIPYPDWVVERKLGTEPVRRICNPNWTLGGRSLHRILHGSIRRIGFGDVKHWKMAVRRRESFKIHAFRTNLRSRLVRPREQYGAT